MLKSSSVFFEVSSETYFKTSKLNFPGARKATQIQLWKEKYTQKEQLQETQLVWSYNESSQHSN